MEILTEKDLELLEHIRQHYKMTGFCLSLAGGAEVMGLSRGGTIAGMFKRLEAAGKIIYSPNRSHYVPHDWRELIAETMPSQDDTTEHEGLQEEVKKLREQLRVARSKKAAVAELEDRKEKDRLRQARFRERKRKERNKV